MTTPLIAAQKSPDVIDYLLRRRSVKIDTLTNPGPSALEIETILRAATRVPDHGRMCPWYFLVFEGEARITFGKTLRDIYQRKNPDADAAQLEKESSRLARAPMVIAVISRARKGKNPIWEQILSAGAVCMNASLATHALGYGVNWVTEWLSYDTDVKHAMGLDERDHVAGFLYIGTTTAMPEERARPGLAQIVSHWRPGLNPLKGDGFDQEKMGFPQTGFDFTTLGDLES